MPLLKRILQNQIVIALIVSGAFFCYFIFWWVYKLDFLPGLHADEAWSGLKAKQFADKGITQLNGMNNYTGIAQILLADVAFDFFGIGVAQLRIAGIVLNTLGLLLLCYTSFSFRIHKATLSGLLILAQSSLYLTSPRVAWEVNSLTLFFLAILVISISKILAGSNRFKSIWIVLFFTSNILGTYNHVIFSCISVAGFAGVMLWSVHYKSREYSKLIILLSINLFNLTFLFLIMRYNLGFILSGIDYVLPVLCLVLMAELFLYYWLKKIVVPTYLKISIGQELIYFILILSVTVFVIFHGIAFFEVLTSYKLLLQVYSFESSIMAKLFLTGTGSIFLFYSIMFLWYDFQNRKCSILTFLFITYLGIFCIYTIHCSFRYYLALYALLACYSAYKISQRAKGSKILIISLISGFFTMNGILYDIYCTDNPILKAIDFKIGNGQIETSAHFLPKQPVLDFLKKNKIGTINYLPENPYFLTEPILFYKLIRPWPELNSNKGLINFDFNSYGNGFLLYKYE